jgi:Na+/melibiose symporter-like transporter
MTLFRVFNQLNGALGLSFLFAYILILSVDITTASFMYYILSTIIALFGYLFYKKLSLKHDMRNLVVKGRIVQIIVSVIGFFIILIPGLEILIWVFLVANAIIGGFMLFDYPIMMLVTDEDEVLNKERREGLILGTNAFFNKIAESIGPIIGTSVLLVFGFVRGASVQTPIAIIGVKFLLLIIPSIINLLGLMSIYYFPLFGANLEKMQASLEEIHMKKTKAYFDKKNKK